MTNDKYIRLIQNNIDDDVTIEKPKFSGMVHPVYIVTINGKKTIFRFSDEKCAKRNAIISKILKEYGITAPEIKIQKFGDIYCETYPFIDGITLYERSQRGLSQQQIDNIYNQIIGLCNKLSKIPTDKIPGNEKYYQTRYKIKLLYFKLMNMAPEKVYHQDLNPKNIILDKNDNLYAILDIDSINKAPMVLAFIELMQSGKYFGFTPKTLQRFCPEIYNNGKMLNLDNQLKLFKILEFINKIVTGRYFVAKQRLLKNETK